LCGANREAVLSLQEIAQIGGIVGVIASMVYVGIQIRNNARSVRAATYQQLSTSLASAWDNAAMNEKFCALLLKAGDDFSSLSRIEKARTRFMMMAFMRRFENAWFQLRVGTLKEGDWNAMTADLSSLFSMAGFRDAWQHVRNRSGAEFRAYVDALIEKIEAGTAAASVQGPKRTHRQLPSDKRKQSAGA
jgi:hypothetical protein